MPPKKENTKRKRNRNETEARVDKKKKKKRELYSDSFGLYGLRCFGHQRCLKNDEKKNLNKNSCVAPPRPRSLLSVCVCEIA